MKISQVIQSIEQLAPRPLQESYDNAGLQVGRPEGELTKALICLDVTEAVVEEAVRENCNLIVSHHPLIFRGLKSITGNSYIERCIMLAIRQGICIYSAHTNLDNAQGGVNFKIAQKLGLNQLSILDPKGASLLKLVTFVPEAQAETVRDAVFAAGAGCIGNYDQCSYNSAGFGTFRANENADPFCGEINKMHSEPEIRIEFILPAYLQRAVEAALVAAHPYEEPAYDFIALSNEWKTAGSGVVGELPEAMPAMDFLELVKKEFGCRSLRYAGYKEQMIRRVALCGGSASEFVAQAIARGADAYLTGEIRYHEYFGPDERILLAELGHYESEQYTMELLAEIVKNDFPEFRYKLTEIITNPIKYL